MLTGWGVEGEHFPGAGLLLEPQGWSTWVSHAHSSCNLPLLPSPGALPVCSSSLQLSAGSTSAFASVRAGSVLCSARHCLCPCQTSSLWQAAGCSINPVVPVCWVICVNVFPPWDNCGARCVMQQDMMQHLPALEEHGEMKRCWMHYLW